MRAYKEGILTADETEAYEKAYTIVSCYLNNKIRETANRIGINEERIEQIFDFVYTHEIEM
jgi:hypothetical protein